MDSGAALEQFLLLSKSAKGRASVALIEKVVNSPGIFVFGELLDMPNVQALRGTEHDSHFRLLSIFAHGTLDDYEAAKSELPALTDAASKKLRMLTVASMAAAKKMIPYSELQEALRISSMRELEDLLIDTIYAGVVRGHLDHRNHCLHAQGVLGRDVPAQSHAIDDMIHKLESWVAKCDEIIATVQSSRAQTLRVVSDHRDAESAMAAHVAQLEEGLQKEVNDEVLRMSAEEKRERSPMGMEEDDDELEAMMAGPRVPRSRGGGIRARLAGMASTVGFR